MVGMRWIWMNDEKPWGETDMTKTTWGTFKSMNTLRKSKLFKGSPPKNKHCLSTLFGAKVAPDSETQPFWKHPHVDVVDGLLSCFFWEEQLRGNTDAPITSRDCVKRRRQVRNLNNKRPSPPALIKSAWWSKSTLITVYFSKIFLQKAPYKCVRVCPRCIQSDILGTCLKWWWMTSAVLPCYPQFLWPLSEHYQHDCYLSST